MPEEDHDEFDQDEHTKIGPAHELAAQSMMVTDDPADLPAPSRNVVRRTGVMPAVRGSGVMPLVSAEGSLTGMHARDSSAERAPERDELSAVRAVEIFDEEPSISVVLPVAQVAQVEETPAPARRIGIWVVTIAVVVMAIAGGGTYGYLRITQLEQRAITAERDAAEARASAADAARRLAARPAKAPPVVHDCPTSTPAPAAEQVAP